LQHAEAALLSRATALRRIAIHYTDSRGIVVAAIAAEQHADILRRLANDS
jgi:hypothetical protein